MQPRITHISFIITEKMKDENVTMMFQGHIHTFRKSELRPLQEEALQEMRQLVMELMSGNDTTPLAWKSTSTDLVEMINDVYMVCDVKDARGCSLTFTYMVETIYHRFMKPMAKNPRSYAYRAKMRKSVRQSSLLDRWVLMKLNDIEPRSVFVGRSGRE